MKHLFGESSEKFRRDLEQVRQELWGDARAEKIQELGAAAVCQLEFAAMPPVVTGVTDTVPEEVDLHSLNLPEDPHWPYTDAALDAQGQ